MLPVYHFTNGILGRLLGAIIWPLREEAGGSSQLSIQRQVNHLLGKVFLLHSLCELSFHLAIWLIYNTTSLSLHWFLFPIPKQKTNRKPFQHGLQI